MKSARTTRSKPTPSATVAAGGLALAGGMAAAPPPARAAENRAEGMLFLSFNFGGARGGRAGLGVDMRGIRADPVSACMEPHSSAAFGVGGRLVWLGWDDVRLTVGPLVGVDSAPFSAAVQAGLGHRFGGERGTHFDVSLEGNVGRLVFARLGFAPTLDKSFDVGGILTTAHRPETSCGISGRPLRQDQGRAPLPTVHLTHVQRGVDGVAGERDDDEAADLRLQAARVWADRACTEWASVPAFFELADQLEASHAPRALIERALAAAADESRHAVLSAQIAALLSGAQVDVAPPPVRVARPVALGAPGLARLAVESFVDGCAGEGAAAAVAAVEADAARVPFIRAASRSIAADEGRHAELAWDVLTWALARAPHLRPTVLSAPSSSSSSSSSPSWCSSPDLSRYGCLPPPSALAVSARAQAAAVRRLAARMA